MLKLALKSWIVALLVWLIGRSSRLVRVNTHVIERLEREGQPYLLCVWHDNIMTGYFFLRHLGMGVLVSRSRDGDLAASAAAKLGFEPLRGGVSSGATAVMRHALRRLSKRHRKRYGKGAGESGGIIVTPCGPRGPRYELKPGVIALARMAKVPIVPMCYSTARRWEFRSWDRMKLSKPFARVAMFVGDAIWLDLEDEDLEAQRLRVQAAMRGLVRKAEAFTGADTIFPEPDAEQARPAAGAAD